MRVILLEDDVQIVRMIQEFLPKKDPNLVLYVATTSQQAVGILKENYIAVAIIDLALPSDSRMDGLEFCQFCRSRNPMIHYIATTGYCSLFDITMCRNAGFDDVILKPFQLEDLWDSVEYGFKKRWRWKSCAAARNPPR